MSKEIIESQWPLGWIPSSAEKGNLNPQTRGLLKMDNLNQDEQGIVRSSRGFRNESNSAFPGDIIAIFSTPLSGYAKARYVYAGTTIYRNQANSIDADPRGITQHLLGATAARCAFLAILNKVFIICGATLSMDDGNTDYNLGIPAPGNVTLSINAPVSIDLNNLNISAYTNWSGIEDATFDNHTNTWITITNDATLLRATWQTIFSVVKDVTNLGGTGKDTDDDIFSFDFYISDADQLNYVKIEFYNEDPTAGVGTPVQDYFWKEWDFTTNAQPGSPYAPFNATSGNTFSVQWKRSEFIQLNTDPTKNWTNIKAIRMTVGVIAGATISWNNLKVTGGSTGPLVGEFQYVAVEVRDDGNFVEFSPSSVAIAKITAAVPSSIHVDRTGSPVNAASGANSIWYFRYSDNTGAWLAVHREYGNVGFTPAAFDDNVSDETAVETATVNPQFNLEVYRTALPGNPGAVLSGSILQMIWFGNRVIYLLPNGFIPSYELDPGSYDSRFVYEVAGDTGNSEVCLFMVKLDVGIFILATTKDFYRVTGDFTAIKDPATGADLLNVIITPLGISDPPISHAFCEFQGSIIYLSATGIRSLTNATSTLINDNLELLFRGEMRYDIPPIRLAAADTAQAACISSGKRIYWSLPHYDGINRVYVLNIENNPNLYTPGARSWRLLTKGDTPLNPITFCREEDGTVLCGGFSDPKNNFLQAIEGKMDFLPIKVKTQYNYGDNPNTRKDAISLKILCNTNNNMANLVVLGLGADGTIYRILLQFFSYGDTVLEIDLKANDGYNNSIPPCIAFAFEMSSYTDYFELTYLTLIYEERPEGTLRALMLSSNFEKSNRKRIAVLPFRADTLGNTVKSNVTADGVLQPIQSFTNNDGLAHTFGWEGDPNTDLLATDWQHELISNGEMEFYGFLPPVITEERPNQVNQVIQPATNFGFTSTKILGAWPFIVDLLGNTAQILVKSDGVLQPIQTITGSGIKTYEYIPPNGLMAVDWEMKVITVTGLMEFFKFIEPPIVDQVFPTRTAYAIMPFSNFGKPVPKKITTWPFICDSLNNTMTVRVTVDGTILPLQTFRTNRIETNYWQNTQDIFGVDWQMEVYTAGANNLMEFYKILNPDFAQIFPIAKTWDQIGPIDFKMRGLAFSMRIRLYATGTQLNWTLFDSDVSQESDSLITLPNQDTSYIINFEKGINPYICRLVLSSSAQFYRFSVEFKVRITGRETEEQWIKVEDRNAS